MFIGNFLGVLLNQDLWVKSQTLPVCKFTLKKYLLPFTHQKPVEKVVFYITRPLQALNDMISGESLG
jgi:hypothetical protein